MRAETSVSALSRSAEEETRGGSEERGGGAGGDTGDTWPRSGGEGGGEVCPGGLGGLSTGALGENIRNQ